MLIKFHIFSTLQQVSIKLHRSFQTIPYFEKASQKKLPVSKVVCMYFCHPMSHNLTPLDASIVILGLSSIKNVIRCVQYKILLSLFTKMDGPPILECFFNQKNQFASHSHAISLGTKTNSLEKFYGYFPKVAFFPFIFNDVFCEIES